MSEYLWNGPDDSDEEIEELINLKNNQEKKINLQFSKKGII
jgi:hypothetical protein